MVNPGPIALSIARMNRCTARSLVLHTLVARPPTLGTRQQLRTSLQMNCKTSGSLRARPQLILTSLYPTKQPLLNKATVTPRGSLYSTRLDTSTRTQPKASQTSVLWLRLTRNPISNLKHKTRPYQKQSWAMIHGSQAPSSFHLFQFGLHWRLCFLLHQRLVLDQIRTVLCNCDLQLWHPLHNVAWQ